MFGWFLQHYIQSMSNIFIYYAESTYPLVGTNTAATATDSMRHNDSYSQVEISHPLPVIRENSYAVISTKFRGCIHFDVTNNLTSRIVLILRGFKGHHSWRGEPGDEATLLHMPQYTLLLSL